MVATAVVLLALSLYGFDPAAFDGNHKVVRTSCHRWALMPFPRTALAS